MILPDYTEVLTPERVEREEALWAECRYYETYGAAVRELGEDEGLTRVLEIGCGTGWVPTVLPEQWAYVGVDASPEVLAIAAFKNRYRRGNGACQWVLDDVRRLDIGTYGIVCSFAVLKHFGLHEWEDVCARILSWGRFAVLSLSFADEDTDNGIEYHHTWISEETWARVLARCGMRERSRQTLWPVYGGPAGGVEVLVVLEPGE